MKKKMLTMLMTFLFIFDFTYGQRSLIPWGVWGNGKVADQKDIDEYKNYNISGFNVNIKWDQIQPSKDTYNWSAIDNALQLLINNDLWGGMMILYGQNCPQWVYDAVPKVTTQGGNDDGPYPYYFDPEYKKYYFNILKQIANHFAGYDAKTRSYLVYWQIAEGSTGDSGPYKGEPTDNQYAISDSDWQNFRHEAWDSVKAYTQGKTYKLLFNGGNDAQYLDYIEEHFPEEMNKDGNLSHDYSFDGELVYFGRQLPHIHDVLFNYRTRGEAQSFWEHSWWQDAPLKQSFTLITSALAGGLDMLNIPSGWFNQNISDPRPTDFFNNYGGRRSSRLSAKGFIAVRDVIDFADIARFPEKTYGKVIDPQKQDQYDQAQNKVDNAFGKNQPTYAWWLKSNNVAKYLNPSRVNMLVNQFAAQGALHDTSGNMYRNDFGVLMTHNYGKFITQMNANETSIGRYRVGDDTAMYGRYAREFLFNDQGKANMAFKVSDSLFNTTGASSVRVQITVTYFDEGNGKWSITVGKDDAHKLKISNTNTNKWKQVTAEFDNFTTGALNDGSDFRLNYISGDNTAFALIEFVNLDKANPLPIVKQKMEGASLSQNIPNPPINNTSINYTLPKGVKNAQLVITDNNNGLIVKQILLTEKAATINVDATAFKNGVYTYSLFINGKAVESKKMLIVR
jgi:hypothetical protein